MWKDIEILAEYNGISSWDSNRAVFAVLIYNTLVIYKHLLNVSASLVYEAPAAKCQCQHACMEMYTKYSVLIWHFHLIEKGCFNFI